MSEKPESMDQQPNAEAQLQNEANEASENASPPIVEPTATDQEDANPADEAPASEVPPDVSNSQASDSDQTIEAESEPVVSEADHSAAEPSDEPAPEVEISEPEPPVEVVSEPVSEAEPTAAEPSVESVPESEPAQAEPAPPQDVAATSTSDTLNEVLRVVKGYWIKVQPILQAVSAKLLRLTSQGLSGLADRLDEAKAAQRETRAQATDAEPLPLEGTFNKIWETVEAKRPGVQAGLQKVWTQLKPLLLRLEELWLPYQAKLKTRLPEVFQGLPDRTLTGLLLGFVFFILWVLNGLFGGHGQPAVAKAPQSPPPAAIAQRPVKTQPVVSSPKTAPSIAAAPADAADSSISTPVRRRSSRSVESEPPAVANPENPGSKTSALQQQLAAVATPYAEDFIVSVAPDNSAHRLSLTVSNAWFDLENQQQDQLAQALQRSSQKLKFDQLEIKDAQNDLLARTPYVGNDIVIFRRTRAQSS